MVYLYEALLYDVIVASLLKWDVKLPSMKKFQKYFDNLFVLIYAELIV